MTSSVLRRAQPPSSLVEHLPVELHGHRKKLEFMWRSIESYRADYGLAAASVRVLEVGCSNGRNVAMPLAHCGYQVTGIDLHAESIAYASEHNTLQNARFLCGYLQELDPAEKFDVVVLSDVLEHVEDPASLCVASIERLAPTGRILISIPNGYGPYELEQRWLRKTRLDVGLARARAAVNRLIGRTIVEAAYNYESGHIQFFHLKHFRSMLDRVGLEVLEMSKGALFGGALTGMLGKIPYVAAASLRAADWLPMRWVSTWYFSCVVKGRADRD